VHGGFASTLLVICTAKSHAQDRFALCSPAEASRMCAQGGCGACTVMLSWYDEETRTIKHMSANACLAPVCGLDGYHVTTVEGIGGMKGGLHPVQQRVAAAHGSQCGV
jgi:xanthine dehydrogenase iron-sulfur cluster and FAD-binding subunit A